MPAMSATRSTGEASSRKSRTLMGSKESVSSRSGPGMIPTIPDLHEVVKVWSKSSGAWVDAEVIDFIAGRHLKVLVEYTIPGLGQARKTLLPTSHNFRRVVGPNARIRQAAGTSAAGTGWVASVGLRTEDEGELRSRETSGSPPRRPPTTPPQSRGQPLEPLTPKRGTDKRLSRISEGGPRLEEVPGNAVAPCAAPPAEKPGECTPSDDSGPRQLSEGDRVGDGRFELHHQIGSGSFSVVRLAKDLQTGDEVALKFERGDSKVPQLLDEARRYRQFSNGNAVPNLYWFGTDLGYNIMALELLGPSLDVAFDRCNKKFSLETTVKIAQQMINLLWFLHERDFLHRDLKPNNFCLGHHGDNRSRVYVVDFGLAKRYRTTAASGSQHVVFRTGYNFLGTVRYASLAAHLGEEQSRRDDMEALGYIFVYFLIGSLPWQGVNGSTKAERREQVLVMKQAMSVDEICANCPPEFAEYLDLVKRLDFEEKPDYQGLHRLIGQATLSQLSPRNSGEASPRRRRAGGDELAEIFDAASATSDGQW